MSIAGCFMGSSPSIHIRQHQPIVYALLRHLFGVAIMKAVLFCQPTVVMPARSCLDDSFTKISKTMKNLKYVFLLVILIAAAGCTEEVISPVEDDPIAIPPPPPKR